MKCMNTTTEILCQANLKTDEQSLLKIAIRQLGGIANNINRIAAMHSGKFIALSLSIILIGIFLHIPNCSFSKYPFSIYVIY
jgi:hypothetical protein